MRGSQQLTIAGEEYVVSRGEYAVIPAGTVREEQASGEKPAARLIVNFDAAGSFAGRPFVARDCSGRVRALSSWLLEQRNSKFNGVARYREQTLDLLVFELGRAPLDRSTAVERSTRNYVLDHIAESITLADLARNAGMSRHYFCRQYHRLTGKSPMMMVRVLRLERARELVLTTTLSLEEIACQVGIRSHYHLSRLLTSHFGVGFRQLRRHATQLASGQ